MVAIEVGHGAQPGPARTGQRSKYPWEAVLASDEAYFDVPLTNGDSEKLARRRVYTSGRDWTRKRGLRRRVVVRYVSSGERGGRGPAVRAWLRRG